MPPSSKLTPSILIALGIAPGCNSCDDAAVGACLNVVTVETEGGTTNPDGSSTSDPQVRPCLDVPPTPPPDPEPAVGPCLNVASPTAPPPTQVGPCLKVAPPTAPPEVNPCLEYMPDDAGEEPSPPPAEGGATGQRQVPGPIGVQLARSQTRQEVLQRGVLPNDVARLLSERLKS